jgi:hypothetical protein
MRPKRKRIIADVNKFSISQMLSNSDGKTSASGTMGVFICLIGGITFFVGAMSLIFKGTDSDILIQSISLVYAGALLLGYRKSTDNRDTEYVDYNNYNGYGNNDPNMMNGASPMGPADPIMPESPIQPEEPIMPEEPIEPEEPVEPSTNSAQNKPRRGRKDIQLNS